MKLVTAMAVLAMLSSFPVLGQAPAGKPATPAPETKPAQQPPAMPSEAKPAQQATVKVASGKKGGRSRANEDARSCLEMATNVEIIKCAEKYR